MSIKFIEDKEFDLSNSKNEDLLGTKPYAETLFEVIQKSKGKQNIGLFGGWGSGKSTIVKTLEVFIEDYNKKKGSKKIAYFKYDAWKYSKDDFRRSFIKSLNSKFKVIKDESINEILYNETTTQDTSKKKLDVNYGKLTLLLISAIILISIIGVYILPNITDSDTKSILVLVSLLGSFLFYLSRDSFRIIPFTVKHSKLIEPERFEETFQIIINKIFGINKTWMEKFNDYFKSSLDYKKVVVVIDNLDRCDNDNLKETLITMKNFLENENVVFLLPVDENGVTSFLNGNSEDAEEYLRKIFHQIIRLKKFTPKELVQYTKNLNENENLNLSNTGIRLICQEFTTNPRKIIQFLNNLQTERELIKRQIKEGYVNLEYNSQADEFLIKLLIIKQEWNSLYKSILDDVHFLNKINKALKFKIEQIDDEFIIKIDNQEYRLTRNQKRFFKRNIDVHFNNLEPFILNIDRDKDVPDELREFIENGELNEIYNLLSINQENKSNKESVKLLLNQIESVYDYNSNKFEDYKSIALPVSEMLFEILTNKSFQNEIKSNFKSYSFINRIFSNNQFNNLIINLNDFEAFCDSVKWFYFELNYKEPYNKLFNYLKLSIRPDTTVDGIHKKIECFIKVFKEHLELIKGLSFNLKKKILENPSLLKSYKVFETDLDVTRTLIDSEFIDGMLELLNQDKIEDKKVIDILIKLTDKYIERKYIKDPLIFTEFTNYFLGKLESEFNLKSTTTKGVFTLNHIVEKLVELLPKTDSDTLNIDEELLNNIHLKLNREYTSSLKDLEIDFYINFSQMIFNYMKLNIDFATGDNMEKYFNNYFVKSDYEKLSLGINGIYQQIINYYSPFSWNFFDKILTKLNSNKKRDFYKTLMLMYNKTTSDKGLSPPQKTKLTDRIITYYLYWRNYPNMLKQVKIWMQEIYKKDKNLFFESVDNLDSEDLEIYVYNLYKLNDSKLIGNSFTKHLNSLNHYKSFEKFIRFVGIKHTSKVQEKLLLDVCQKDYPPFNWLFSAKNIILKPPFNKVINRYLESYNKSHQNTDYLNNLLKLNKEELHSSTIKNIVEFMNNIIRPTKRHKDKIGLLKKKIS